MVQFLSSKTAKVKLLKIQHYSNLCMYVCMYVCIELNDKSLYNQEIESEYFTVTVIPECK